jgi:hypothetical protein
VGAGTAAVVYVLFNLAWAPTPIRAIASDMASPAMSDDGKDESLDDAEKSKELASSQIKPVLSRV